MRITKGCLKCVVEKKPSNSKEQLNVLASLKKIFKKNLTKLDNVDICLELKKENKIKNWLPYLNIKERLV